MDFLKNSQNEVLVCIPTYNAEDAISDTVKSVLAQSFKQFDVLILDNQSTDHTVEVLEQLKRDLDTENKIHIVVNKENLGRVGNWNQCIELFKQTPHPYLKFVFVGDTLEDNCLAALVRAFQKNPGIGLVTSGYYMHIDRDKVSEKILFKETTHFTPTEALKAFIQKDNWIGALLTCMFSREAIEEVRFPDGLGWASDCKLYVDIIKRFNSLYINESLANFNVFERKYLLKNKSNPITRIEELYIKYYVLQKLEELDFDMAENLRKKLHEQEGKYLFSSFSFYDIGRLIIYKLAKYFHSLFL